MNTSTYALLHTNLAITCPLTLSEQFKTMLFSSSLESWWEDFVTYCIRRTDFYSVCAINQPELAIILDDFDSDFLVQTILQLLAEEVKEKLQFQNQGLERVTEEVEKEFIRILSLSPKTMKSYDSILFSTLVYRCSANISSLFWQEMDLPLPS